MDLRKELLRKLMRKVSQRKPNETLPEQLLSFGWLGADLLSKDMPDEKKQAFIMQSQLQPVWAKPRKLSTQRLFLASPWLGIFPGTP